MSPAAAAAIFYNSTLCHTNTSDVVAANTLHSTDDNVPAAYWSCLEAFVSIICCCLPAIRSLLRRIFPTCFGSTDQHTDERTYRVSKSPMPSIESKKIIVSHQVSVTHVAASSGGDSDDIELVPRGRESEFNIQGGDQKAWGQRGNGW